MRGACGAFTGGGVPCFTGNGRVRTIAYVREEVLDLEEILVALAAGSGCFCAAGSTVEARLLDELARVELE